MIIHGPYTYGKPTFICEDFIRFSCFNDCIEITGFVAANFYNNDVDFLGKC